jgi:hypothetical protein
VTKEVNNRANRAMGTVSRRLGRVWSEPEFVARFDVKATKDAYVP